MVCQERKQRRKKEIQGLQDALAALDGSSQMQALDGGVCVAGFHTRGTTQFSMSFEFVSSSFAGGLFEGTVLEGLKAQLLFLLGSFTGSMKRRTTLSSAGTSLWLFMHFSD